jgi:hypothetical protein
MDLRVALLTMIESLFISHRYLKEFCTMPSIFRSQLDAALLPARKVTKPARASAWLRQHLQRCRNPQEPKYLADALLYDGALHMH